MIRIVPMSDAHVLALQPQDAQGDDARDPAERLRTATALRQQGSCWAVVEGDEVLMLGGVGKQWEGRAYAWALLSRQTGRQMVAVTRAVRRYLDALDYRRIEMYVDAQFASGCRWAEMLGFVNETPSGMRGFLPNGNTAYMFGRAR